MVDQASNILRWFTLALAPIVAGVVSLLFRRRTFAEHFVFTLHVFGFALLVRTLFSFVERVGVSDYITEPIQVFVIMTYALIAMRRVYGDSIVRTWVKFVTIATLSVLIWLAAGASIIALTLEFA